MKEYLNKINVDGVEELKINVNKNKFKMFEVYFKKILFYYILLIDFLFLMYTILKCLIFLKINYITFLKK